VSRRAVLTDAQWERIAPLLPSDVGKALGSRPLAAATRAFPRRQVAMLTFLRWPSAVTTASSGLCDARASPATGDGLAVRLAPLVPVNRFPCSLSCSSTRQACSQDAGLRSTEKLLKNPQPLVRKVAD
jgi:hypothetical protein